MAKLKLKVGRLLGENIRYHKKVTSKYTKILGKKWGQSSTKQKSARKQSDFAKRLLNTKKLSIFYGNLPIRKIQQNQLYTYLDKNKSLMFNLETRLDVILVRAQFCCTLYTARQFIMHRKICVNSKIVNYPGLSVSNGDIISISLKYRTAIGAIIKANCGSNLLLYTKPSHLEINYKIVSIVLLYEPSQIVIPYKIDLDLI